MSEFRRLAEIKKFHSIEDLQTLLDELANAYEFGAPLILSALKDHDPVVRCYAARKLGLAGMGRPDIVDGLADALKDKFTTVRQYASAALGVLDPLPLSAASAIKQATDDEDATVREFSASNLKLIERQLASEAIVSDMVSDWSSESRQRIHSSQ